MTHKLSILYEYLEIFNANNLTNLSIDTIRVNFSKQHKLSKLKKVGFWHKVTPSSKISSKLKKRLSDEEVTSAYQLEDYNIYFFNSQDRPLYRKATMVMFGLTQYNDKEVQYQTINRIINILDNISNIDICYDFDYKPNLDLLTSNFTVTNYKGFDQTYYCNTPNIPLIEKFYIYNKALKNNLNKILHRIEFKVNIFNIKDLYLPLQEIQDIISLIHKGTFNSSLQHKGTING